MAKFEPIKPRIEPYINFRYTDLPDEVKWLVRTPPVVDFTDLAEPMHLSADRLIRRERGLTSTGVVDRKAAASDGGAPSFPKPGEPCFLVPWDALSPSQRLEAARQWDYEHDPAYEAERQDAFDLVMRMVDLEREIATLQVTAVPTASDLVARDRRLSELHDELGRLIAADASDVRKRCPSSTFTGSISAQHANDIDQVRRPTDKQVSAWLTQRVRTWPKGKPFPTEHEDREAARAQFPGIKRNQVREARNGPNVPPEWRKRGPRKSRRDPMP